MPTDREADEELTRESIWSVKDEDRPKFSIYFTVLFAIGLVFSFWYEIFHVAGDSVFDTIFALLRNIGLVGIAAVVLTFARFEGEDSMGIALDIYRKRKFEEGRAVGVEEGRAENRAEINALRKRIAELESRNGSSPDESHPSHSDDADER